MTAFNGRLKPKRVFGFPMASLVSLVMALPMSVIGLLLLSKIALISALLFFASGFLVIVAFVFFVLGDEVVFLRTMYLSKLENHNVTSETWTKF